MYRYFRGTEVKLTEHMLYLGEIAQKYGLFSVKSIDGTLTSVGKPNTSLVKEIIKEYVEENNIQVEEYYYPTAKGLYKVYQEQLYKPAIERFFKTVKPFATNGLYINSHVFKNGKSIKFVVLPHREEL